MPPQGKDSSWPYLTEEALLLAKGKTVVVVGDEEEEVEEEEETWSSSYPEVVKSLRPGASAARCQSVAAAAAAVGDKMHPSLAALYRVRDGQDVWNVLNPLSRKSLPEIAMVGSSTSTWKKEGAGRGRGSSCPQKGKIINKRINPHHTLSKKIYIFITNFVKLALNQSNPEFPLRSGFVWRALRVRRTRQHPDVVAGSRDGDP